MSQYPRRLALIAVSVCALTALGACSNHRRPAQTGGPGGGESRPSPALMFSPNGEPLNGGTLGQPSCSLAMNYWFDRTDANHDGRLDREEFLADARAQFAKMDLNSQGYITNDELSRYRRPFREGTRSNNVIDPVMTADKNLNFMVTSAEFLQHADEAFTQMDADRNGVIDRADLTVYCAQQATTTGGNDRGDRPQPPNGPGGGPGGGRP